MPSGRGTVGTTPPGTSGGTTPLRPPQPWGEGGADVVAFASLGYPSYTIGSLAADPSGHLWFEAGTVTQRCLNQLDPVSTDLTSTVRAVGRVATGQDGSVWYTTDQGVVRQDPSGEGALHPLGVAVGSENVVHPISIGPDARAWVSETDADAVVQVDPGGAQRVLHDGIPPGARPGTISAADDGSAWFTEPDVHLIGHARADGAIEQLTVGGAPEVVVAAPGGGAWFFDSADGTFGRIDAQGRVERVANATPSSPVVDLTVAPDGSVWYVADPGIVGRFGDGLPLQELPIVDARGNTTGAAFHHPKAITADSSGTIWFTDWFYGGEGSSISLYAVVTGDAPTSWPDELPVHRPIGATITTCGDA